MLSDREQQAWCEIERRVVEESAPGDRFRLTLSSAALTVVLLVGPNQLTAPQIAERRQSPAPRESSVPVEADAHVPTGEYLTGVERTLARETVASVDPTASAAA